MRNEIACGYELVYLLSLVGYKNLMGVSRKDTSTSLGDEYSEGEKGTGALYGLPFALLVGLPEEVAMAGDPRAIPMCYSSVPPSAGSAFSSAEAELISLSSASVVAKQQERRAPLAPAALGRCGLCGNALVANGHNPAVARPCVRRLCVQARSGAPASRASSRRR